MADGDPDPTAQTPSGPTPDQEQAVNAQLFGGKKPENQTPAPPDVAAEAHADPLLDEKLKIYESDKKRYEESQSTYDTMRGEVNRINEELKKTQAPQIPQPRPYPQQGGALMGGQQQGQPQATPEQQANQGSIGQTLMQVASIIAIGSAVFGRHRNPYSQIVQQSAIGGFLSGIAQGQKDKAHDQLQNWNKAVELTDKLNKEDTQTYKDVLANRRLDLTQQMDLLKDVASQRGDMRMYEAATKNDLTSINKILDDKFKARAATIKAQIDVNTQAVNKWLGSPSGLSWSNDVKEKFHINPYESHDKLAEAFEKYPISKWQADKKSGTTTEGEEEKPTETQSNIPHVSNDEELENIPKGTTFVGPDGIPRTKNW
jgi:hypothetical protein